VKFGFPVPAVKFRFLARLVNLDFRDFT
jgi:hypothetical protein